MNNLYRIKHFISRFYRNFSTTSTKEFKITICGGCGETGAPLSLLLKINPLITELRVQDTVNHTLGVAKDLSHIEHTARVEGFSGDQSLVEALKCADVVTIAAGISREGSMTTADIFTINALTVKSITETISLVCPTTMIVVLTNPINMLIPIVCEVMKSAKKFDSKRIFGVTTLDNVRAATFAAEKCNISPKNIAVPVIGGHSGKTIVPLFSRIIPELNFSPHEIKVLTDKVQEADKEVIEAKMGFGSVNLSLAYAGARFINSLLCAMKGESDVVECSYTQNNVHPAVQYFAAPFVLGKYGVESVFPFGNLSNFEKDLLNKSVSLLKKDIQRGVGYVKYRTTHSYIAIEKDTFFYSNLKKSDQNKSIREFD